MNCKVSRKDKSGKWRNYGNVKRNQFGNLSLGLRVTKELKELVSSIEDEKWLNFSLFEDNPQTGSGEKLPGEIKF